MPMLKPAEPNAARRSRRRAGPEARPAVQEDFEQVVRLADSIRSPKAPSLYDVLLRHFAVPWQQDESPGFVLAHGPEVVGFMATLTHRRRIGGDLHTICNLGSWYVSESHRRHSMALAREALRRRDISYTAISPIARVARVSQHFDFQSLETHQRIIYPTISLRPPRPRPSITVGDVSSLLAPESLQIYRDHRDLLCEHAVLEHDGQQCYMVLVRSSGRFSSSARIDYLSDQSLFRSCIAHVAAQLCRKLGVTSISVADRFLGDTPVPFSKRRQLKVPDMFRSSSLGPTEIDSLYSECAVMGI